MTFRVEEDLRERFADAAKAAHRPAAQVLRELMRTYVERAPAHTANTISEAERGRRQEAVDFARANIGLEGLRVDAEEEAHAQAFIDGEIDMAAFVTLPNERSR